MILDFYCPEARLAIEVDGGQHFTEEGIAYDAVRTEELNLSKIQVLRFTNAEVKQNPKLVVEQIVAFISKLK